MDILLSAFEEVPLEADLTILALNLGVRFRFWREPSGTGQQPSPLRKRPYKAR